MSIAGHLTRQSSGVSFCTAYNDVMSAYRFSAYLACSPNERSDYDYRKCGIGCLLRDLPLSFFRSRNSSNSIVNSWLPRSKFQRMTRLLVKMPTWYCTFLLLSYSSSPLCIQAHIESSLPVHSVINSLRPVIRVRCHSSTERERL